MSARGWIIPAGATRREIAEIDIAGDGVTGRTAATTVTVPWSEMRLEIAGAMGDMAFCHHRGSGAIVCSDDPAFARALRDQAPLSAREALAEVDARARRRRSLRRGIVIGVLLAGALIVAGVWWGLTAGLGRAVESLPASIDRDLGDSSYASMELGGPVIDAPAATAAIDGIVQRLAAHAHGADGAAFEFRVAIVRSDQVNAFALPGGRIVVYTGLIEKSESAEQVAGVIGHEMAHVTLRHGLHGVARQLGWTVAVGLLLGDVGGLTGVAAQGALSAAINGYSRDMERAADAEGGRMLAAAGMDVRGIAEFFALLKQETGSESVGIAQWFSTHPEHDERIASARELAAKLQPEAPPRLTIDWAAVKASLKDAKETER